MTLPTNQILDITVIAAQFNRNSKRGTVMNQHLTLSVPKKEKDLKSQDFRSFFGGDKRNQTADLLNAMETISILLQFLYYSMYHLKIQNAA